jgi:hypothetical protein
MNCICSTENTEFKQIKPFPIYKCENCSFIFYEKKINSFDIIFPSKLLFFSSMYILITNITYREIYFLNWYSIEKIEHIMKNCENDSLFIVYNTNLIEDFSFEIINDFSSTFLFNYESINNLVEKSNKNVSFIQNIKDFTIFKIIQ